MTIIAGKRRPPLINITLSHSVNYIFLRSYTFVTVYCPPPPTPLSDTLSIALSHLIVPLLCTTAVYTSVPFFHHSNVVEQEAMLMQTRMLQDTVALFKRR